MRATKKAEPQSAKAAVATELVRLAKEEGLSLTGPVGLLNQFTETVLETALNEEMLRRETPPRTSGTTRTRLSRTGTRRTSFGGT